MARRKLENSSKSAPCCCTTEFWGEWVQRCCDVYPGTKRAASPVISLKWLCCSRRICCENAHEVCCRRLQQRTRLRKGNNAPLYSIFWWPSATCEKKTKKVGELCKAKDGKVGAFEERGHLFSALQARRFSTLPGRRTYNWWRQELVSKRHTERQKAREVWYFRRRSKSLAE